MVIISCGFLFKHLGWKNLCIYHVHYVNDLTINALITVPRKKSGNLKFRYSIVNCLHYVA